MKILTGITNRRWTVGIATISGMALVGGCASHHEQTAYRTTPAPVYSAVSTSAGGTGTYAATTTSETTTSSSGYTSAAGGTAEQQQSSAGQGEGNSKMVVPLYKESIVVGKRQVDAGTIRLKKTVKTETINQPVELRHEELVIDKDMSAQATEGQMTGKPFEEQETVIRLTREEPVIEKQTTSAGQILVQTRYSTSQTNIQGQIRREDIGLIKEGDTQNVTIGQNVQGSVSEGAGGAESAGGHSAGSAQGGTITDPAMLSSTADISTLAGRPVQLSGLKVNRAFSDRLYVLTSDSGQTLYALANQLPSPPQAGDMVNVVGSVKQQASSLATSGLNDQATKILGAQPFYIDAQQLYTVTK
jgi:uncharacterized protein (TIGR02271 family)